MGVSSGQRGPNLISTSISGSTSRPVATSPTLQSTLSFPSNSSCFLSSCSGLTLCTEFSRACWWEWTLRIQGAMMRSEFTYIFLFSLFLCFTFVCLFICFFYGRSVASMSRLNSPPPRCEGFIIVIRLSLYNHDCFAYIAFPVHLSQRTRRTRQTTQRQRQSLDQRQVEKEVDMRAE